MTAEKKELKTENLVIIGSGPLDIPPPFMRQERIYSHCSLLVLNRWDPGGQLMTTTFVENFLAPNGVQGPELMDLIKARCEMGNKVN